MDDITKETYEVLRREAAAQEPNVDPYGSFFPSDDGRADDAMVHAMFDALHGLDTELMLRGDRVKEVEARDDCAFRRGVYGMPRSEGLATKVREAGKKAWRDAHRVAICAFDAAKKALARRQLARTA